MDTSNTPPNTPRYKTLVCENGHVDFMSSTESPIPIGNQRFPYSEEKKENQKCQHCKCDQREIKDREAEVAVRESMKTVLRDDDGIFDSYRLCKSRE